MSFGEHMWDALGQRPEDFRKATNPPEKPVDAFPPRAFSSPQKRWGEKD